MELGPAAELRMVAHGVQDDETGGRPFGHGHRDGPVRLDDGRRLVADQLSVECRDLPPVGIDRIAAGGMTGGDRGMQLIGPGRSEEHTSELQSPYDLVCRLLLDKKKRRRFPLRLVTRKLRRKFLKSWTPIRTP